MSGAEIKPVSQISEREFIREALRILPRLMKDDAQIRALQTVGSQQREAFGLFNRRNKFMKPVLQVKKGMVSQLMRQSLLEKKGDACIISHEGVMWLRRQVSNAEPFGEQHQSRRTEMKQVASVPRPVIVNDGESPLGWLHRRKDRSGAPLISTAQFQAGERLREDFERGQLMPSTTSSWDGIAPSRRQRRSAANGASDLSDSALASRERVSKALTAAGPELAGVLVDVCCHLAGLSETEKNNGWPQRSGKVILQIALSKLARHYGFDETPGSSASACPVRIAHWGADGYRPSLESW